MNVTNATSAQTNSGALTNSALGSAGAVRKGEKMNIQQRFAIVATIVLGLIMILQLLLAMGFPLGQAAWGGQNEVLSANLRWASLATVGILGLAAWIVLSRANLARPGAGPVAIQMFAWVFAVFLSLNTLGNIASSSAVERYVMAPVVLLLVVCFVVVALSPHRACRSGASLKDSRLAR
jgi:hypothetical protein